MIKRQVVYFAHYKDGDVDSVNWKEAKKLVKEKPSDVALIERCVRFWETEDESLMDEKCETLWEAPDAEQYL